MARDHDEPPEAWAWGAGRYERDDGRREHDGLMHVEQPCDYVHFSFYHVT